MRINHNHITPKIYIAIPCYDGNIDNKCTSSLLQTILAIAARNWDGTVKFIPGDPVLESVRNKFVSDFMNTDCTHLFMIDADVGWQAEKFIKMIEADRDVICGIVPIRQGNGYALEESGEKDGELVGLNHIGAAFMCVKRDVIQQMQTHHRDLRCYTYDVGDSHGYNFFEFKVDNGYLQGEDVVFCKNLKDAGFKIWGYPNINFTHAGKKGNYRYRVFNEPILEGIR